MGGAHCRLRIEHAHWRLRIDCSYNTLEKSYRGEDRPRGGLREWLALAGGNGRRNGGRVMKRARMQAGCACVYAASPIERGVVVVVLAWIGVDFVAWIAVCAWIGTSCVGSVFVRNSPWLSFGV